MPATAVRTKPWVSIALPCLAAGLVLAIAVPSAVETFYLQPRLAALEAEDRRLDAEIAHYKALLPELERVTAERDAKRRELLMLEEEMRARYPGQF